MIFYHLFILCFNINATVIIPTESANLFDFKNHLYEKKANSYTEWYLNNRTHLKDEMLIIKLFNEAQKFYLNGDLESSKNNYLKIINMEHDKDWKEPQRQLIIDSYLQIIKISKYNKHVYLNRQQAYAFKNSNKKNLSLQTYSPKHLKNWQSILINGVHYNINDLSKLKFTNSLYRWTLLSDKAQPHTEIARPQDFFNKYYPQSYFYSNSEECRFIVSNALPMNHIVFQNNDCNLQPVQNLSLKHKTKSEASILKAPRLKHASVTQQKKWYHSKWFWIGTAALTGLVLYKSQSNDTEKGVTATHTEGF